MNYCDGLALGGNDDWRLPDIGELKSLVDDAFAQPTMDTRLFTDFPATRMFYWSSTEKEGNAYRALGIIFNYGTENDFLKKSKLHVRCVRKAE
jgi:hypothetical protein